MTWIRRWLIDSVTFAEPSGITEFGDPTFTSKQVIAARVEEGSFLTIDEDNNELQATHKIATLIRIPEGSRIWFDGDDTTDNTVAKRVIRCSTAQTKRGTTRLFEALL